MKKLIPIYALLTAFTILMSVSCNSSDDNDGEPVTVSSNTLITAFSLTENDSVIADLDSLQFTIDVANRVIYNADSLPKGTKINRLVANITYNSTATGTIKISGAETMQDTTYTYSSSNNDSIDFTGNVTITIAAPDGISSKEYRLKVNVHKVESDSLYWNELSRRNLPGSSSQTNDQKTVQQGSTLYCMVKNGSTYSVSANDEPATNNWDTKTSTFGFTPDLSSFTATDDAFYILSNTKELYTSTDAATWTATGASYEALIGAYENKLLCLSKSGNTYYHEVYSNGTASGKEEIEEDFPITGFSQCVAFTNDWSVNHQILFIGGKLADGSLTGDVWGFDGQSWGKISRIPVPGRMGATLVHYYNYTGDYYKMTKYPVWLAFGGIGSDGKATSAVYISYDNGVTWKLGDDLLQLPDYMGAFSNAQAFVYETTLTRASASGWTSMPSRHLPYWWTIANSATSTRASQAVTSWQCPYIYVFGGVNANGELENDIWKGVINRLTFKPII